tara:strand:+ start:3727 stop:4512 length:786 start_codon:yes stop_codon:yes gene_type:complete
MIVVAGCGRMGEPMLAALRRAGHQAWGFDVVPKDDSFITTDISKVYAAVETLITVVRDIAQTEDVLFNKQAFIDSPNLKRIVVSSTLSPRYVQNLRARIAPHIALIDAPMSGARIAAQQARLSFMLGGSQTDIAAIRPLLSAMGSHFHHMGDYGAGMQAKVLNNMLAAANTAMTRLVLDWADHAGIHEANLLALIHTSSGQNWFASGMEEIEFSRDGYARDNTIGILVKDIASALDAAPPGADIALPTAIQSAIANLKPRP